jgi:methylglutaconyl-CoA hydratase
MSVDSSAVLFSANDFVARITLNRPEKRNALNDAVIAGVADGLRRAESSAAVRVVVIRGAGRDFCSGADLSALRKIAEGSVMDNREDAAQLADLFRQIRGMSIPVVAAVHGRALAGGCGLASACDIVLASRSARFGYPEVKIGFVPAMVMAILRRNVSEKRAFELITRGAEIGADEAERIGLVNQVFGDDDFDSEIEKYLAGFAKVSRSAVALSKQLLYHMDSLSFDAAIESGIDTNVIARFTDDCKAGVAKFLKK